MYIKQNIIAQLLFIAVFSCVAVPTLHAASYAVSPLLIDKELKKRDSITETITLRNTSGQLVRIFPTVNEVSVEEGGTVETFVEPSMITDKAKSITSWIEIGRGRIELKPNETKEIALTIRVNPEVDAGEYHAFIGFPEGSNRPEAEKVVYTGSAPGTVVRIGVDKVQNEFLRLTSFTTDRFVKSDTEGAIEIGLTNTGDSDITPLGEVIFYNKRGVEVGTTTLNEEKVTIKKGSALTLEARIPSHLTMGKYKAFLIIEYGKTIKTSINDTAFFYVLPLRQLIIIFGSIVLLTTLLALFIYRKMGGREYGDSVSEVGLYVRTTRSEPKEHDIDLSKKNEPTA